MHVTTIVDTNEIERQVREIYLEIARLQVRRRELNKRIHKLKRTKQSVDGTYHAAQALQTERDQLAERIVVLKSTAASIQNRSFSKQAAVVASNQQSVSESTHTPPQPVIQPPRISTYTPLGRWRLLPSQTRSRIVWTLGNALMLLGVVLLLYVGGLYTHAEYARYAARGDTDVPAPVSVIAPVETSDTYEPAPFTAPNLSVNVSSTTNEGLVRSAVPDASRAAHQSTVTRVVIPSINVDSKVVEVGWEVQEQNGQQVAVWQVAEYAVGQHRGSGNPGEGDNIVLAGHVGGYGKVFKDLYYVQVGDQITLYSEGQQYLYVVQEIHVLDEEGVPPEQQAANARFIAPTDHEVVTLVTCWPPKGPDRFKQRIVVRAVPFANELNAQPAINGWTIR